MAAEKLNLRNRPESVERQQQPSAPKSDENALQSVNESFESRPADARASAVHALIEETETRLLQTESIFQTDPAKKWPLRRTALFVIGTSLVLWAALIYGVYGVASLL